MRKFGTALALLTWAAVSNAQIGVNVDNKPVQFSGQRPVEVQGRVMVPLRGVLEALGAYVDFESSTRTITANKGTTQIEMKLGERAAMVNGRQIMLDVPAMTMRGSTMVPLRFIGEALGADVKWVSATSTVDIWTDAGPGNTAPPPTGTPLEITGIDVRSRNEWLRPGDTVDVEMSATPGLQANFRIPGLIDRVEMRETSAGVYQGSWKVTAGTSLSGAKVLGEIVRGTETKVIQASASMNVDTTPPVVSGLIPEDRNRVPANRLSVSAVFDDASGSGVRAEDVVLRIDGKDVTREATVTSSFVSWRPDTIVAGRHTAELDLTDRAGNTVQKRWEFNVSSATTAIQSFTHNVTGRLEPGDVITTTLRGEKGSDITFSIGGRQGIPMSEKSPGVYTGEYVVRRGDNFTNAPVIATMRTAQGEVFTIEADKKINASVLGSDTLKITSPKDGVAVASPLVVQGKAAPGARVLVRVGYATTVVGGLRLTGRLFEDDVVTDANGNWRTPGITLRNTIRGNDVIYPVSATLIVPEGQEAPKPVEITLKKKE